jgi:hypothetical protein
MAQMNRFCLKSILRGSYAGLIVYLKSHRLFDTASATNPKINDTEENDDDSADDK